jgi:hypothetical protein
MSRKGNPGQRGDSGNSGLKPMETRQIQLADWKRDIGVTRIGFQTRLYDAYGGDKISSIRYGADSRLPSGAIEAVTLLFPEWFVSGASGDSNVNTHNLTGLASRDWVDELYFLLQIKVAQQGRFIRFDNFTGSGHTMQDWIGAYMGAYAGLNLFRSIISAGRWNLTTETMLQSIVAILPSLEGRWDKLAGVPMPQGLIDLMEYVSGAFAFDSDSQIWFCGGGASPTTYSYDVRNGSDITSMITNIDNAINVVFNGNGGSVSAADASNLLRLFGLLYPNPVLPTSKIKIGPKYVDPFYFMMIQGSQDSPAGWGALPNQWDGTNESVDILLHVRKGVQNPLQFTLWRPQFTETWWGGTILSGSGGTEQLGVCQQPNDLTLGSTFETDWKAYDKTTAAYDERIKWSGPAWLESERSAMWQFWYVPEIAYLLAQTSADIRPLVEFDPVSYQTNLMVKNHINLLNDVFLNNARFPL